MSHLKLRHALLVLATGAALVGCGGGDDRNDNGNGTSPGASASDSDVPEAAQQSAEGLITYVKQLIATMTNETSEPVRLGGATLPVSDTTEASN